MENIKDFSIQVPPKYQIFHLKIEFFKKKKEKKDWIFFF